MNNSSQDISDASILAFPPLAATVGLKPLPSKDHLALLDTVLNNMSQGVLMFDTDARLVFCNRRYIEMYRLSPEIVVPGCGVRELLSHRKAVGTFCGNPEDYIGELLEVTAQGKTSNGIAKAADGRVFSIVRTPIASGGWIATRSRAASWSLR